MSRRAASCVFENPNSPLDDASIDVVVTDGESTEIELTITDSIDADVLNAFTGWAAGFPTLDGGSADRGHDQRRHRAGDR